MIILDTSILIDHIRQKGSGRKTLFDRVVKTEGNFNICISIISFQELFQGQSTRDKDREEDVLDNLSYFKILGYDDSVALSAGKLVRDWNRNMGFADAAIAATALENNCSLFTLNTKDFYNIPGLGFYHLPL